MPALKNAKHEAFAQGIHLGLSQEEAYEQAGYVRSNSAAYKLAHQPDVAARIEEMAQLEKAIDHVEGTLRDQVFADLLSPTNITHAWFVIEAYKNVQTARALGEIGDANKALELIAKAKGLFDHPDLPPHVKKAQQKNGTPVSTDRAAEDRLSQFTQFAQLLGKPPRDFVEAADADADERGSVEQVGGPDGDE